MVFGWPSYKTALGLYSKTAFQLFFGFYGGLDYDCVEGFWAGLVSFASGS